MSTQLMLQVVKDSNARAEGVDLLSTKNATPQTHEFQLVWAWTANEGSGATIFTAKNREEAHRKVYGEILSNLKKLYSERSDEEWLEMLTESVNEEGAGQVWPVFMETLDAEPYSGPLDKDTDWLPSI